MSLRPLRAMVAAWRPNEGPPDDPLAALSRAWPAIVGPNVAQHSHPLEFGGGALLVATRSSAWSQQLQFLAPEIMARVAALGGPAIARLRFRSGALRRARGLPAQPAPSRKSAPLPAEAPPSPAADEREALERVRIRVGARVSAAARLCAECGAPTATSEYCAPCAGERENRRRIDIERLLFNAPWLEFDELRELISGLGRTEVERARRGLLARWWVVLERARRSPRKPGERERQIASSYVLLHSGLAPERITPEVVRNLLGDDLESRLFGPRAR